MNLQNTHLLFVLATVLLTPEAIRLLERLYERRKNEWVFTNRDGERLSYEALRY